MTQDEHWNSNYQQIMDFMAENKRRPSKHRIEEHQMLNWPKHQKKCMTRGTMKTERMERFNQLMDVDNQLLRKNQHAYVQPLKQEQEDNSKKG